MAENRKTWFTLVCLALQYRCQIVQLLTPAVCPTFGIRQQQLAAQEMTWVWYCDQVIQDPSRDAELKTLTCFSKHVQHIDSPNVGWSRCWWLDYKRHYFFILFLTPKLITRTSSCSQKLRPFCILLPWATPCRNPWAWKTEMLAATWLNRFVKIVVQLNQHQPTTYGNFMASSQSLWASVDSVVQRGHL